ncbi:MAG: (Fe-S)-binding protein [Nitrosomonas sp.]|nr:(Fe-S)-binding protein [Nitrosomonas sp.]
MPDGAAIIRKSWLRKWLESDFITKPTRFDQLRIFLRVFQRSGLQQRLQKSNLLGKSKLSKLVAQLPSTIKDPYVSDKSKGFVKSWQAIYPAVGKQRGDVGLFLGCVARLADVETINSTIFVLNRLGYTVHVPSTQTCCGALHQHGGDVAKAMTLARQNKKAFGVLNLSKIITTASGCGVQLIECDANKSPENNHLAEEAEIAYTPDLSSRVIDVSKFLSSVDGWDDVEIRPLASKIAVQEPCSLRNVLRDQAHVYTLLERIPKLQVTSLAGNDQCCGAAGTYFIDQPNFAMKLQAEKISAINENNIRYLVTSNIGCSLHIASGLRIVGSNVEVLHPVTLLARQMGI